MQLANEIGPARGEVAALARIRAHVEEQKIVAVEEELPASLADGALPLRRRDAPV